MKAGIISLSIAITLFIYVYKPSDYEHVAELPTGQYDAIMTQRIVIPDRLSGLQAIEADLARRAAIERERQQAEAQAEKASKPKEIKTTQAIKPPAKVEPTLITVESTHYVSHCDGCTGITKTGIDVRNTIYHEGYRIIAVDPRAIPLNTIVRVTYADGTTFKAIAADIGSAIKGKRIDVLVETKREAYALGRQNVTVEILK